jgi:hypothetical protein
VSETREHSGPGWRIELPDGVIGGPAERVANPELLTSSIFRGWIGDEPFSVIVSTRKRTGTTLRRACEKIAAGFRGGPPESHELGVPGAKGARRVDGLIDLEEGLGEPPDWTERFTVVVAAATRELVLLTVRRRPDAELGDDVEAVVGSLRLVRPEARPALSSPVRGPGT